MKLINFNPNSHGKELKELYLTAFPKYERKPFDMILEGAEKGIYEILSIESDTGKFLGLAITILCEEYALLDYFAVLDTERGNGVGTKALNLLINRYNGKKFFLESESTAVSCSNLNQRKRRKKFYEKCGMSTLNFQVNLFGTIMEILAYNCTITFEEYYSIQQKILPKKYANKISLAPTII
ncbi:MAG: GNAT family N-acetyltransferase [Oscillospiraceae bacterium]|nr:GNAT family N-acetyltransferase [Oscillospiraceae bacterium]